MSYNFLKEADYIRNSTLCMYDTLAGYTVDFSRNGDVDGWDIYNNIYMYGCWNNVLFGTSFDNSCYIQRPNVFLSLEAEEYFHVELVLKITSDENYSRYPTTGKLMWLRTDDSGWDDDKSVEFELKSEDNWQRYEINMGEQRWWQGYINNLRVYPFINGHKGCKFAIKEITIKSANKYTCKETSCDYFLNYEHPCGGRGESASIISSESKSTYTTVSGISDTLYVNIDDYGDYLINLGTNIEVKILTMCRILEMHIQGLGIGGYIYSEVSATIDNKIEIKSGTTGVNSSVKITGGTAAPSLGFFTEDKPTYISTKGVNQASHFDYASSVRLSYSAITKLLNDDGTTAYTHKPDEFNVEMGSKDFYYNITANSEDKFSTLGYNINYNNIGTTIIDVSHPATNNGLLTDFYVNCGRVEEGSRIYILRPKIDGTYVVVDSVDIPTEVSGELYTVSHTTHHIKKPVFVNKGDVLAVYNASVKVSISEQTSNPNACFFIIPGKPSGTITPQEPNATGVYGFSIYASSSRLQNSLLLDIDFGNRVNASKFFVKGTEYAEIFEYNIAICEDLNWQVDCRGDNHLHILGICWGGIHYEWHQNIPYGTECLNDGVTSPEGGKQGDFFSRGSDGIVTIGEHSYFYVNGDGEWAYGTAGNTENTSPIFEFYNPPYCSHTLTAYEFDPIHFILDFPYNYSTNIHKTAMYFKEAKNFKHFAHQYYIGSDMSQKTGKNVGYHYVPDFNNIVLDSVKYDENSFVFGEVSLNVRDYLFVNPCAWPTPIYINNKCVNWDIVQTSRDLTWNVIEHEFDPIDCSGYRYIVDYHVSTKMSEFEVYSSFPVEPSLVDNVLLTMSVYGDKWHPAAFEYSEDEDTIEAAASLSPRYFRLSVFSQDIFKIDSFSMTVTDSIKTKGCEDEILLTYGEGYVSDVQEVSFENLYNTVSDFTVGLPNSYNEAQIKVLDLEFNGEDTNNDILIVHKNPDHYLALEHGQIANNCNAYALSNLITDKPSYLLTNAMNIWKFNTDLSHDVSLDLTFGYKGTSSNVIFEEVSSRYLYITTTVDEFYINNIVFYFGGQMLSSYTLYFSSFIDGSYISRRGVKTVVTDEGDMYKQSLILATFQTGAIDYSVWSVTTTDPFFTSSLAVYDNEGAMELYPSILIPDSDIGIKTNIEPVVSFYLATTFNINCNGLNPLSILYEFYNANSVIFYFEVLYMDGVRTFKVFDLEGVEKTSVTITSTDMFLEVTRVGSKMNVKLNSSTGQAYLNSNLVGLSTLPIDMLKCVFNSYEDTLTCFGYNSYCVSNIELYALNIVSTTDMVTVDFGTTTTVDRFKVLTSESITNLDIKYSRFYNSNCYSTAVTHLYPEEVNNYLAIDFLQKHKFKMIRNYGSMSNKLPLTFDGVTVQFSSDDTNEAHKVDWGVNYDKSRIVFESGGDTTSFSDLYNTERTFSVYGAEMTSNEFVSLGSSCYFNGSSLLGITDNGDYNFLNEDFGLSFYVFLGSNIYEEKVLISKWGEQEEHKAFYIGLTADKTLFFKFTTDGVDTIKYVGNTQIAIGSWVSVELSRKSWYLYMFIDGTLDSVFSIGSLSINSTLFTLYLGGLFYDTTKHLFGYIDNFHVRKGSFIHIESYDIHEYENALNNNSFGEYRWIKIKIPTTQTYTLDKLGIYPDINTPILATGGYNCGWEPLGTGLTDYVKVPYNIAGRCIELVESSGEYDFYAENVIDGTTDVVNYNECWGFAPNDLEPTLIFIFDDYYKINKVKLYHGAMVDDGYGINDFIINGYPTASGVEYTELVSVTNNIEYDTVHVFDPIVIQKLELKITNYTSGNNTVTLDIEGEQEEITLDGGFLREIEIYTDASPDVFDSDYYPIVCFDLNYQFSVSRYQFNSCDSVLEWYRCPKFLGYTDNISSYTSYSDNAFSDPRKVRFVNSSNDPVYLLSTVVASTAEMPDTTMNMETNIYFVEGSYMVTWQAYNNLGDNAFCLEFVGMGSTVELYPENIAEDDWAGQTNNLNILHSGLYNLNFTIKNDDNAGETRQAKGVKVYKSSGTVRWLCFTDNTAENYSFDTDIEKKHAHYLVGAQVFASGEFLITEYSKWWLSNISELSENYIEVKVGSRSLQIDYPTSSSIDYINFRECDNFIKDDVWMEKDFLSFWWYIDNIDNFDTNYGAVGFGNINSNVPVHDDDYSRRTNTFAYGWNISDINLNSGWNKITLQFSECASISPLDSRKYFNYRHPDTNVRNSYMKSFIIYYKGTGSGPIRMYIDGLNIQRCLYEEPVKKEKALCLSYNEFAELNLSNLDIGKGTISFWAKMYCDSSGVTLYGDSSSRTLLSITSSDNDIILFGIKYGTWFEFGVGDSFREYVSFSLEDGKLVTDGGYIEYDESFHVTLMWSYDGQGMSNNNTFRLYLNNELFWSSDQTWEINSFNAPKLVLGGGAPETAFNNLSDGSAIFESIKVYNYCTEKSDYTTINNIPHDKTDPNDYVFLSADNVNFYGKYDKELPITVSGVNPGEKVNIYIKSVKTKDFKKLKKKTAELLVDWLVAV